MINTKKVPLGCVDKFVLYIPKILAVKATSFETIH